MVYTVKHDFQYLKFVEFKDLDFWSVKTLIQSSNQNSKFHKVEIGKILLRNRNQIEVQDNQEYNRVTIRLYNKGVKIRDTVKGSQIGVKRQTIVKPNLFILSKIDARNGAFGVVPDELDGAITTADFLSYEVNKEIVLPEFLNLFTATKEFVNLCESSSNGTTGRKRVSEPLFLKMQIPLPTLEIQKQLVKNYQHKITQAQNNKIRVLELEKHIETYLMDELGIEVVEKQKQDNSYKYLQFVEFKELERWDTWNQKGLVKSDKYELRLFGDLVLDKPMYGSNTKAIKQDSPIRYIRITDIDDYGNLKESRVSSENPENRYLLEDNDFLIARSGSVGRTFLYKKEFGKCIFAGYLVKYKVDFSFINSSFLQYYTQSRIFKIWVDSKTRKSSQPNVNGQEYLTFPIPLPPLEIQEKIVALIDEWKAEIKELKESIKSLEIEAKEEFESGVFN